MWFGVIGNTFAFLGSVLFSSGLLQTREQITDENATYFDANPYTTKSSLGNRRKNIIAFFMIVTGFAITLGGSLGEAASVNTDKTILLCVLNAFCGYFIILYIYLVNMRKHHELKCRLKRKIFYGSINGLVEKYQKIIGQYNEKSLFTLYKSGDLKQLRNRLDELRDEPDEHMKDIIDTLSRKRTALGFVGCVSRYLKDKEF